MLSLKMTTGARLGARTRPTWGLVSPVILGAAIGGSVATAAPTKTDGSTVLAPETLHVTPIATERRRIVVIPAVEVGVAKPIGAARTMFSTTPEAGLSASVARADSRWRLSLSLWLRPDIDPSPADRIWFFGGWVHPEVTIFGRFVGSVGLGWAWRHIDIDGVSSTHGSLSAMWSAGLRFRPWTRTEVTVVARDDFSQPIWGETFLVENLSLCVAVALVPPRSD